MEELFGWKTSRRHWNDDAVWGIGPEPNPGPWWELRYPPGHPLVPASIDLAFGIVSEPVPIEFDWGDAGDPPYPTYAVNNGPRHQIGQLYLGNLIDGETNGQPTPDAMGDDLNGVDDEDGVTFVTPLIEGQMATVRIDMTSSAMGGFVDGWIEHNQYLGGDGLRKLLLQKVHHNLNRLSGLGFRDADLFGDQFHQLVHSCPPRLFIVTSFYHRSIRLQRNGSLSWGSWPVAHPAGASRWRKKSSPRCPGRRHASQLVLLGPAKAGEAQMRSM